jgi:hypothetical protein
MVTFAQHKHSPDPVITMSGPDQPNEVTFFSSGVETLRISDKGFWVRGKKVKVDDKEAQTVYNSFKEWLTWQQLNRG